MQRIELLVIGGGAAGQAAAIQAAQLDIRTMLIDEGPVPREWMTRQLPHWYGERLPELVPVESATQRYLTARPGLVTANDHGVDVHTGCTCWGLFAGRTAGLYDGQRAWFVQADNIILATGSYENPLAFVGRSLPGVLGGLGALDLLETHGTLGGERVVILGSGNFGLEVARRCQEVGHQVAALVDVLPEPEADRALLAELERAGTEIIPGYTIVHATGTDQVEQVMLAGVDEHGRRTPGESFPVRADTLCVAIGRVPSTELAYLIGCDFRFDSHVGGYYPVHSERMETSVPGIFVVGDSAGAPDETFTSPEIAGMQGRIAALSVATKLGRLSDAAADCQELTASIPLTSDLSTATSGRTRLWQNASMGVAPDDVVLCRCEGITRADLKREFHVAGDRIPDELKRVSRVGMGVCQGRGCRMVIAELLASRHGTTPASVPLASYRPPVRPIPMIALAEIDPPEVPLHPAFAMLEQDIVAEVASGLIPAERLAAATYKLREENFLARGLPEVEIVRRAHELGVTIRTVRVH